MKLKEDRTLYSGVFWVKDINNPTNELFFLIDTDLEGNPCSLDGLNAKSGITYNHKLLWNELSRKETEGKPFNYFPRGRVQIKNGVVDIYLNPNLNRDDIIDLIIDNYNLTSKNGIRKIRVHEDHSEHYKCYLD